MGSKKVSEGGSERGREKERGGEREREKKRERGRGREREGGREGERGGGRETEGVHKLTHWPKYIMNRWKKPTNE